MPETLEGKVAIITGASSGIGRAVARALAGRGARLALAARSMGQIESLADELGSEAVSITTDVTNGDQVRSMVAKTVSRFGNVDILFANAGIYIPGEASDGDPDAWATLIDTNVNGVLRCVHAVLPHMIGQSSGDILVTTSISGYVDIEWEPVYSASKHAVVSFVHTLRRQVAKHGIRVGSIGPGMVANELWGYRDEASIATKVDAHESIRSEDVADLVIMMLTRPSHVTIRDLVVLPQRQDL